MSCKHNDCKECEHKNMKYCDCCDSAYCTDCKRTWYKRYQVSYAPNYYPWYNYTTGASSQTVGNINTTTAIVAASCGHFTTTNEQ